MSDCRFLLRVVVQGNSRTPAYGEFGRVPRVPQDPALRMEDHEDVSEVLEVSDVYRSKMQCLNELVVASCAHAFDM
jgi:hypothetical protein